MIERRIAAAGARSLRKCIKETNVSTSRGGGGHEVKKSKRVPPSASARKQFRDGAGEAPRLVFLDCVPGASIRGFPGIALLCSSADAASVRRGAEVPRSGIVRGCPHVLGLLLALFVGARARFSFCLTSARGEVTLVKRV
jgi:hypothetical protein